MTDIEALQELAKRATPGPWKVQTGCSWRRVGTHGGDGDVLRPTKAHDGWPDLAGPMANLEYIAAADPQTVLALIDALSQLQAENTLLKQVEANLCELHNVALAENAVLKAKLQTIAERIPRTPEAMVDFIGSNFNSMQTHREDGSELPTDMICYSLTVHDLLSAFSWSDLHELTAPKDLMKGEG